MKYDGKLAGNIQGRGNGIQVFEKFPGGIGIVADDLAAGYFAAACLIIGWKVLA